MTLLRLLIVIYDVILLLIFIIRTIGYFNDYRRNTQRSSTTATTV